MLKDAVAYHVRESSADLRQQGLKTAVLQVSLGTSRHGDWFLQGGSIERVFSTPTCDLFELLKVAGELVDELYRPGVPYKKAGILFYGLVPETVNQLEIFDNKAESKTALLTPLLDKLNAKLKGGEIIVGSFLKGPEWHSSSIHRSPAYTTAWKDIATVKA